MGTGDTSARRWGRSMRQRLKPISKNIENQNWDEDDHGFKITAPTKP
jgi:hypothetical protein